MTSQEIFDSNLNAYTSGKTKFSVSKEGVCRYFKSSNCRCAIGRLLPIKIAKKWDSSVDSSDYGSDIQTIAKKYPEDVNSILPTDYPKRDGLFFLQKLQNCHDYAVLSSKNKERVKAFVKLMRRCANEYKLDFPKSLKD